MSLINASYKFFVFDRDDDGRMIDPVTVNGDDVFNTYGYDTVEEAEQAIRLAALYEHSRWAKYDLVKQYFIIPQYTVEISGNG